jgi:hypothetical protein
MLGKTLDSGRTTKCDEMFWIRMILLMRRGTQTVRRWWAIRFALCWLSHSRRIISRRGAPTTGFFGSRKENCRKFRVPEKD